jgi:hypothetical protein
MRLDLLSQAAVSAAIANSIVIESWRYGADAVYESHFMEFRSDADPA